MSNETMQDLNKNLIGFTSKRGHAWHYREDLQGAESNHYEHEIPVEDVHRRLFPWHVVEGAITATHTPEPELTESGVTIGEPIVGDAPGYKAIMRDDNGQILGIHSQRYGVHQYDQWLIENVATLLDADLKIGSAGVLKQGAQAWVQIELPDTLEVSGVEFRPFLTAATSHDGSLATTYLTGAQVVVCDNTLSAALGSAESKVKVRHSSASLRNIQQHRDALGIIFETGQQFGQQVAALTADKVSDREWLKFVAAITKPVGDKVSERSKTMARNKVEEIVRLWEYDERVAPWKGTAFGVVQAVNTWTHHLQTVRGATRFERNASMTITGGWDKVDQTTLAVLESVR